MTEGRDFLPPDVKSLVDAERHRLAIPDDARGRLASKLALTVPSLGHGSSGSAPPGSPASGASGASGASAMFGTLGAKVLVVLSLVGAGVVGMHALPTERVAPPPSGAEPRIVVASVPVSPPPVSPPPEVSPPASPAATLPTASVVPSPASVHAATVRGHAEISSAELAEERRLLDAARASILRGAPEEALPDLASHSARFPDGTLTEERLALQIRALSRLGRIDEARALLSTLASRYPHSFVLKGATDDVGSLR